MQLEVAWLSKRIRYCPDRFLGIAAGIINAKNGVDLDLLLERTFVGKFGTNLRLWDIMGLFLQTSQGELTKAQWNSLVTLAVNMVADPDQAHSYKTDIFLLVRQSPTVEKMVSDKLLPRLLEDLPQRHYGHGPMMVAALLAARSLVSDSTSLALDHLEHNGYAMVYFFLCLSDHALRQHDLQKAQVCLLEAINRYSDGRRKDVRFDDDKMLFTLLGATKDKLGRPVHVGPPLQPALTPLDKFA
jgi:hypothetical protein